MKHTLLSALFIGFLFFLFTGNAFAQNPGFYYGYCANGQRFGCNVEETTDYDWEKDSKLYKSLGWSFFGVGLAVTLAAPIAALVVGGKDLEKLDIGFYDHGKTTLFAIAGVGGAMLLTGIGLLIADAIKFHPYRQGEIAGLEFKWRPELYASPEFSGFGLSARF